MRGREKKHETSQGCRAHENRARLRLVASRSAPAPRILLEESDDRIRTALESALHRDGYDVTACREGVTLLDKNSDVGDLMAQVHKPIPPAR